MSLIWVKRSDGCLSPVVERSVDEGETPEFNKVDERGDLKRCENEFERVEPELKPGVSLWGDNDIARITLELAEAKDMEIGQASRRFGVLRLRDTDKRWFYSNVLGVYGDARD